MRIPRSGTMPFRYAWKFIIDGRMAPFVGYCFEAK